MKKILLLSTIMISFSTLLFSENLVDYQAIPQPVSIEYTNSTPFTLDAHTQIEYPAGDDAMKRNAQFLAEYVLKATGISLEITDIHQKKASNIVLSAPEKIKKGQRPMAEEGYHMQVSASGIRIQGSARGVFYGIQMLRKSLPYEGEKSELCFRAGIIDDAPRFGYRGMHLDCARHFFSVEFVKEYIDLLALHQMNTFHWHLTDDQGWRIEVKAYPRLTEVGAWREGTVIGRNSEVEDGQRYGGFYTQDQIREVVAYAAERHVTVIPEIDMPGHMLAALAAYPELGCTGGPYKVGTRWGIYRDILCIGNEKVYTFIQNILDEVLPLFPSQYVHIGGDEAPQDRWKECPRCKDLNQSDFTRTVAKMIKAKGKRVIGWEEMMNDNEIDKDITLMAWRGMKGGIEAVKAGHDIIMTPLTNCYFDYVQDTLMNYEPEHASIMPIMVDKVYSLDVPDGLTKEQQQHILGIQANLWTEYVGNDNLAEYMILPRMAALSECQWTPSELKDWSSAQSRILRLMKLYDAYGWNYGRQLMPERPKDRWHL